MYIAVLITNDVKVIFFRPKYLFIEIRYELLIHHSKVIPKGMYICGKIYLILLILLIAMICENCNSEYFDRIVVCGFIGLYLDAALNQLNPQNNNTYVSMDIHANTKGQSLQKR